jgi:hypothetical protein
MLISHLSTTFLLPILAATAHLPRQQSSDSSAGRISGAQPYNIQTPPLDTPWTYSVGTDPWKEYPRPQLARKQWKSLNGLWAYQDAGSSDAVKSPPFTSVNDGDLKGWKEVLVPSCLESGLSGMSSSLRDKELLQLPVPESLSGRC